MVGFRTVSSDYRKGYPSIRSICPIIDNIDCTKTTYFTGNFNDMDAPIGGEPVTQTLNIDTYSQWYGAADGYSFCSKSNTLEMAGPLPQWMSITNNNIVTIGAHSSQHPEDSFDLKVSIKREGQPDIERFFNAELKCMRGDACDLSESLQAMRSEGGGLRSMLSVTNPICDNYIKGHVADNSNSKEEVWYVPRRFYMLTKV